MPWFRLRRCKLLLWEARQNAEVKGEQRLQVAQPARLRAHRPAACATEKLDSFQAVVSTSVPSPNGRENRALLFTDQSWPKRSR